MAFQCDCDLRFGGCTCGAMQKERQVARLADSYKSRVKRAAQLMPRCVDKDDFVDWTCCEEHKKLGESAEADTAEARALHTNPHYQVLSPAWWQGVGRQDMFDFVMDSRK